MNEDKQNKGLCKFLTLGLWSLLKAIDGFVEFAHQNLLALTNLGGRVIYTFLMENVIQKCIIDIYLLNNTFVGDIKSKNKPDCC